MALFTVSADKQHLSDATGQPFFALGANYAGYFDRAWKMWESDLFDPELITRDFRKAQNSGFNSIRLFVHAALERDIRQNNFDKLDQVLSIAQDHKLRVMLTLNDSHSVNLPRVADVDAKIAERYKDITTIFAYDLQNEPVFYNLVAAMYPNGYPAPVQTSQLIEHYGERVSRDETQTMQQARRIPTFLDADTAYYYINALRLFLEYDRAMKNFVNLGKGTIVDFMLSPDAEPWYAFIGVMDATVDAWLRARIDPIRDTGCRHLLNVGWSWLHFATLPANRILDFQQYHNYTELSQRGFNSNLDHLKAMRQAFPRRPIIFGEFGWSNQSDENPVTSQPVSAELTSLYESATIAYLKADDFAGAFKWKLNDVDVTNNPREASFGVFKVGDQPKPIRDMLARLSQDFSASSQLPDFVAVRDQNNHIAYKSSGAGRITVGGSFYQDDALTWQAGGEAGHVFIQIAGDELMVDAPATGRLSVAPWQLVSNWDRAREANLFRVFSGTHRTRQSSFAAGQNVEFDLVPGAQYAVVMGAQLPTDPPPDNLPLPDPSPGEHVVLLGNSDHYLQAALGYIRRFGPDFTFAADDVPGKWAYVTVVATPEQIPDATLDDIRSTGTLLVERVVNGSPASTRAMLDDMAKRGQRFLAAGTPVEPEPPPGPEPEEPTEPAAEYYVVQPGDTLGGIAKKVYGSFSQWPKIYEANRDKLSSPSLIRVGMELLIPPAD
jgi:hypothetical protein